jgi:nucleotide-binding universal stress UspA family protein
MLAPTERAFRAALAEGGVEAYWTFAAPNETPLQLASRARLYDLAIAPRPRDGDHAGHRLAELAVLTSGTPCLVTAEPARVPASFNHVLVAWNGSREAKRALEDGLVFLKRAKRVGLLVVGQDVDEFAPAEAVLGHLARHGVTASLEAIGASPEDDGSALLRHCERFGADLLVMGGYGHSRAAELILGGATRTVLAQASLPVLMSH